MRIVLAGLLTVLGLILAATGTYLGLVYFVGYDGVWTPDLLWILVPAALGLGFIAFGVRALRGSARSLPVGR